MRFKIPKLPSMRQSQKEAGLLDVDDHEISESFEVLIRSPSTPRRRSVIDGKIKPFKRSKPRTLRIGPNWYSLINAGENIDLNYDELCRIQKKWHPIMFKKLLELKPQLYQLVMTNMLSKKNKK